MNWFCTAWTTQDNQNLTPLRGNLLFEVFSENKKVLRASLYFLLQFQSIFYLATERELVENYNSELQLYVIKKFWSLWKFVETNFLSVLANKETSSHHREWKPKTRTLTTNYCWRCGKLNSVYLDSGEGTQRPYHWHRFCKLHCVIGDESTRKLIVDKLTSHSPHSSAQLPLQKKPKRKPRKIKIR